MSNYEARAAFDGRLAQREAIALGVGRRTMVRVIDLAPKSNVTADTDAIPPLVFVPSVLGDPKTLPARLGSALHEFWESGRRVIVVNHSRRNTYRENDGLVSASRPDLPERELGRAAAILAVLDAKGIPKADIVAQCEGAVNSSIFAFECPERVRSLVLVNPSGMGKGSLSQHIDYFATRTIRSLRSGGTSSAPRANAQSSSRPLLHVGSNPLFRIPNLNATAQSRIDPLLGEIEAADVRVGILKGSTDRLYPPALTEQYVDETVISKYEVMSDPRSGHDPLINLPTDTARIVLDMQNEMCTP